MKKFIALILICCFLFQLNGCYTLQLISKEDLRSIPHNEELVVKTNENVSYSFEEGTYTIVNDLIIGRGSLILENGAEIERNVDREISLEEVDTIKLGMIDEVKTILFVAATVGLSVLLVLGLRSIKITTIQ